MKKLSYIIVGLFMLVTLFSCNDKTKRNVQYMPDMYRPVPYEPYSSNPNYKNGLTSQEPVEGTVARGQVPYDYPNTNEGYEAAKLNFKSPVDSTKIDYAKGKKSFGIYCAICHGNKGDGQSILSERDKFTGVPNYATRDITEGSIYHVIMYGKGSMGSHASQLKEDERWQIVHYVQKLRADLQK